MSDNKYQRGKIYRIVCNTTGLQYYGSTIENKLCTRLAHHKAEYKRNVNKKTNHYVSSFKILENNNYEMILVENFVCNSKDELHQRERFYIENNECVNRCIPLRTKEEIPELVKIYYENHKENILDYHKKYYVDNKDILKEKRNIFYEENKDIINENRRKSYEANKDIINENRRKKIEESKLKKLMII